MILLTRIAWLAGGFLSLPLAGVAHAQSFNYPHFSSASLTAHPLKLNGNAAAPATGLEGTPVLRLTAASANQQASAFSLDSVPLNTNIMFSTAFAFQLSNGGGSFNDGNQPPEPPGADGIVFVLTTASNNVGATGQGVGYQGIPHSVGIKFDTWQDGVGNGFPQDSDPNGNFVAVYTNGSTQTSGYIPYSTTNPAAALQYYTPPTYMKNGDIWYAWIDYNGATGELDVRLSDGTNSRPANPQLSQIIFLTNSGVLGASPAVYAGFTSATGAQYQDQDILNWQFFAYLNPAGIPALNVEKTAGGLMLAWPASAGGFWLEQSGDLTAANWVSNTTPATVVNGTNQVTITPGPGNSFFRLMSK